MHVVPFSAAARDLNMARRRLLPETVRAGVRHTEGGTSTELQVGLVLSCLSVQQHAECGN